MKGYVLEFLSYEFEILIKYLGFQVEGGHKYLNLKIVR